MNAARDIVLSAREPEARSPSSSRVPRETREALGIADGFVRVSAGIEAVEDLQAGLERGFAAARKG